MSEERDDQGKWVRAFLLGMIVGALLVVGVGGGLFMVKARQASRAAEEAAMEAERARAMAEEERLRAEEQAARAPSTPLLEPPRGGTRAPLTAATGAAE
jgi:septal ring factor EnvC (AmiA/AmiB activator)